MSATDGHARDLARALSLHEAGDLAGAEAIYARLLATEPANGDALHMLGVAAYQRGDFARSVRLITDAIRGRPDPAYFFNLGFARQRQGLAEKAVAAYRIALALRPDYAEALNNLGNVLKTHGRPGESVIAFGRALALQPTYLGILFNRAGALHALGRLDAAEEDYRGALAHLPATPDGHYALSTVLRALNRPEAAEAAVRRSLALRPDYPEWYNTLGVLLQDRGEPAAALACHRIALRLKPDYAEAHNNLANALQQQDRTEDAAAAHRRALALRPDYPEAHNNLGNTLQCQGHTDRAVAAFHRALTLRPGYADAHLNLAFSLLLRGDFAEGWEAYEWRWRRRGLTMPGRGFPQPLWRGERGNGKTLLLHCEQGLGDTIQFARYVPLAAERGWSVVFEVPPPLMGLFEGMPGVSLIEGGRPLPPFDAHCPLMSLPRAFATAEATIPAPVPYLHAPPEGVARWRARLAEAPLRVGLVWAGNPSHRNDRNRSIPLARLAPWLDVPGVRFHVLQKDVPPADRATLAALGNRLTVLGPDLAGWTDTAAVLGALDLLISVDTSAAHLAGALGRPVWLLLPFAPDWRWRRERDDSPWYPTMRLFRQPAPGDWEPVFARIAGNLARLAASRAAAVTRAL